MMRKEGHKRELALDLFLLREPKRIGYELHCLFISNLSLHCKSSIYNRFSLVSVLLSELLSLLVHIINASLHVESDLGQMIQLTLEDHLEALDGLFQGDELAHVSGEHLGDLERLRQELLDLTGSGHDELVVLRKLVHTEDSNDILERLVVLKDLLDTTSDVVMVLSDDVGVHDTRGRVEGIHGGVDSQFGNTTRQHSGGVKMGEGGGRRRVSQIVSRHVDSLDGGDGSLGGGGNTLLHTTHVSGERGLVTDSRGDTSEKGRHLRTSLSETEDVVDEEKHILSFLITEILGDSETSEAHTSTGTRGLVHLSVHEGHLRVVALEIDDTSLNHLVVEIVTLTSTLSDSGEDRVTSVSLGDVVDQLHDKHSLSDSSTTEETDLSSLGVRGEEIDDLDSSHENLLLHAHLHELGGFCVNGGESLGVDGTTLIDGLSDDVHDTAKSFGSHGDLDGSSGVEDLISTDKTLSSVHGNGANDVVSKMLGDFKNESGRAASNLETVENRREVLIELDVNDGTDDSHDASLRSTDCLSASLLGGSSSALDSDGSVDVLLVNRGGAASGGNGGRESRSVRLQKAGRGLAAKSGEGS